MPSTTNLQKMSDDPIRIFSPLGYNGIEQTVRMRLLGWDRKVVVKPLSEIQARDLGAELLGELIVLLGAIAITSFEYNRSSRKEKAKEKVQNDKLLYLQKQISDLKTDIEKDREVNLKLTNVVRTLVEKMEDGAKT